MEKFLIKVTSTGTAKNPHFAGISMISYSGKGSLTHVDRDVYQDDCSGTTFLHNALIRLARDFGYVSESSAKCGLAALIKFHNDEASRYGFHTFEHEIISIEI